MIFLCRGGVVNGVSLVKMVYLYCLLLILGLFKEFCLPSIIQLSVPCSCIVLSCWVVREVRDKHVVVMRERETDLAAPLTTPAPPGITPINHLHLTIAPINIRSAVLRMVAQDKRKRRTVQYAVLHTVNHCDPSL